MPEQVHGQDLISRPKAMSMLERIREKARELKKQVLLLYLAYRHPGVPWYTKLFLLLVLLYALSPIDLIPDAIPVLGMLDDLILIPLGIYLAVRMIPGDVWEACRGQLEKGVAVEKKYKIAGAALIVALWVLVLSLLIRIIAGHL